MKGKRIEPRFWFFVVGLEIFCLFVFLLIGNMVLKHYENVVHDLTVEYGDWYMTVEDAKKELEYAKTNEYVEEMAHLELDFLYPNEIRYVKRPM